MQLNTLIQQAQLKGYKIDSYESHAQFSLILREKDGTHIKAWHETFIPRRVAAKEEITEKLEQILKLQ